MSSRTAPQSVNISKTNNDVTKKIAPKTGTNVIEVWADMGTWDATASAAINTEKTNLNEPK